MLVFILLAALAAAVATRATAGREASAIPQAASNNEPGKLVRADRQTSLQLSSAGTAGLLGSRQTLQRYAEDTWASFVAMTDPDTGLPADALSVDGTRSVHTSTTNIGAYMWSTVVAEKLGIISHGEAVARLDKTLGTLERMERHEPSGQFYNWYDIRTGEKLTYWPPTGEPLTPILSYWRGVLLLPVAGPGHDHGGRR